MITARTAVISALSLLAALAACTYENDVALELGTDLAPLALVGSEPAPGQVEVLRAAGLTLSFDRPPDASWVSQLMVRVFSGPIEAPGRVQVDLLQRSLTFVPLQPLRAQLRYQLYLSDEIRGLDGSALPEPIVFDFTTGQELGEPPPPPASVRLEALQPLWQQHCLAACHAPPEPRANLDLSSPQAAFSALWGIASNQWELLLVEPGNHARSYLMRKLLDQGGTVGFAMPPQGAPLTADELRQVANWIDTGSTSPPERDAAVPAACE